MGCRGVLRCEDHEGNGRWKRRWPQGRSRRAWASLAWMSVVVGVLAAGEEADGDEDVSSLMWARIGGRRELFR